jgi:hypothetical protein
MKIKFKNILTLIAFTTVLSFETTASSLDCLNSLESSLDANCGNGQHYTEVIDPPSVSPLTLLIAGRNFNKLTDERCIASVNEVIADFSSNINNYNVNVNVNSEIQNQKQLETSNLRENTRLILL